MALKRPHYGGGGGQELVPNFAKSAAVFATTPMTFLIMLTAQPAQILQKWGKLYAPDKRKPRSRANGSQGKFKIFSKSL